MTVSRRTVRESIPAAQLRVQRHKFAKPGIDYGSLIKIPVVTGLREPQLFNGCSKITP